MSLQNLSLLPFVLGLLALGGVLFALQRLRVRHRDLRVPTTLFWKAAVERARARTLVERFRHPLPFLLVLCIAWLLWTSMAGPRRDGDSTVEHLVLIDASAGMAGQDRLALAKEEAARVAASLPRNFTTIRLCGSIPETVLLPGENPLLLERRLGMVEPAACPSTIERELRMLPAAGEHDLQVWVIGGQPIDASLRELLPERIEVVRIACGLESLATNRAITALAATEAASGRYDRCDVFIEARGAGSGALAVTIGADSTLRIEPEIDEGRAVYRLADVPADAGLLRAELLSEDPLALDDRAELRLPRRRIIRVQVAEAVNAALRVALGSDPAIELVENEPDVVVRAAGGPPLTVPSLEYALASTAEHAFVVRGPAVATSARELAEWLPRVGLDAIDAMELAEVAARPISIGTELAELRSVQLWSELLTERFDFTRSRAFPLFVGLSVRWLVGEAGWRSWVAAGERTDVTVAVTDAEGRTQDPCEAPLMALEAGHFQPSGPEASIVAALLDPRLAAEQDRAADVEQDAELPGIPLDWPMILALAALLLLGFEWVLYRSGRMP